MKSTSADGAVPRLVRLLLVLLHATRAICQHLNSTTLRKARPGAGAADPPPCAVRVGAAPQIQPEPVVPAPRNSDGEEPSSKCPLWGDASVTAMFRGTKPDRSALGRKRFSCEGHRKRRLRQRSAVRRAVDAVRAGTTVWFIGDSVTVQHERAFACRLWDELAGERTGEEPGPRLEVMNETTSPYYRVANPQNNWCARTHCITVSRAARPGGSWSHRRLGARHRPEAAAAATRQWWRTCYVQAGGGCYYKDSVRHVIERLVTSRPAVLRRGDVAILNEGLHLHKSERCPIARMLALASSFAVHDTHSAQDSAHSGSTRGQHVARTIPPRSILPRSPLATSHWDWLLRRVTDGYRVNASFLTSATLSLPSTAGAGSIASGRDAATGALVDFNASTLLQLTGLQWPKVGIGAAIKEQGLRVIWRETSPQAFPGAPGDGSWKATYMKAHAAPTGCVRVERPERPAPLAETIAAFEQVGLPVIRTWDSSVTQWDSHLERRTNYSKTKSVIDCTHWCEPSGAIEEWNDAMLDQLSG